MQDQKDNVERYFESFASAVRHLGSVHEVADVAAVYESVLETQTTERRCLPVIAETFYPSFQFIESHQGGFSFNIHLYIGFADHSRDAEHRVELLGHVLEQLRTIDGCHVTV